MDDQQAIALLERMVSIPSLSTDEAALAAFLVEAMAAAGFDAHIDEAGNAIGAIGAGAETVVLLGHMDTVPGAIPVRIEDGALW
ncbi:MAG TPA: acetyl-lysine deacetylase, partial [Herpetosiphonaceae bacterium]